MLPERLRYLASNAGLTLNEDVKVLGKDPILPSRFPVGELAAVALAGLGSAAADVAVAAGAKPGQVSTSAVAGALTTIGFAVQRLNGEPSVRSNQSNPFVRCYQAADGRWIFLHGGFENLAKGLAEILGVAPDATIESVRSAISGWNSFELEDLIAQRNLCGAVVRSQTEWLAHPQGKAVAAEPTVRVRTGVAELDWHPDPVRPLKGLRVLDLTRVLAGPTCGKYLAALGAEVTNIRSTSVPVVPSFVLETGVGKTVMQADLIDGDDLRRVRSLARNAHVIVQGYRPGVVERFGLDAASLIKDGWAGIYASINCYGHVGPWSGRAGWEQLAQAVSGIAHAEGSGAQPAQVPAALNDYVTGLLMATAITRQLSLRTCADMFGSLCQTAAWVARAGAHSIPGDAVGIGAPQLQTREVPEGTHQHLGPGFEVGGLSIGWTGSH